MLLVDCDPQGNSTSGMGVAKDQMPNVYDLLVRGTALSECIEQTPYGDVLPANRELSGATVELVDMESREYVLKTALLPAKELYDYIFIDCPPSLELLTVNALAAADSVLIPVQCEYYALEGITDLMQHGQADQAHTEHRAGDTGHRADNVRLAHQFLRAGGSRSGEVLRQQRV